MDRVIVIAILLGITVVGVIMRFIDYRHISKRIETTYDFRNRFVDFINALFGNKKFDDIMYISLMEDVNSMQVELGSDGIMAIMRDPMRGIQMNNYPILVNFLPKLRNYISENSMFSSGIITESYEREAGSCDDAFIRHIGSLNKSKDAIRKRLMNPIDSFTYGVMYILIVPFAFLSSFGLFSENLIRRIIKSNVTKIVTGIVAVIAFIASVLTITVGWMEFIDIVLKLFNKK
jgi:hypothetical protein